MTAELRSGGGDNDRLCDGRWGDASYSGGGSNTSSGEIHGQLFRGTQPILGGLIKTNSGKSFVITPPGERRRRERERERESDRCWRAIYHQEFHFQK